MNLQLLSPIPGTLRNLADLTDPVFAQEIMGPGFAIAPDTQSPASSCMRSDNA